MPFGGRLFKRLGADARPDRYPGPDDAENRLEAPGNDPAPQRWETPNRNWAPGCETLCRDYIYWDTYKDHVVPLGIKTIRLQGGWAKTEKVQGVYDFAWLDYVIDDALSKGRKSGWKPTMAIRFTRGPERPA